MRYGFYLPTRGPTATSEALATLVQRGEALGFHAVVIADHLVFPVEIHSKYPYTVGGAFPGHGDALDQLALMAFVAAKTRTLRLVTSVMILPYRNPVVTAKTLATIDVLSGGRVTVGVGVGWLREEFEALGMPFDRRGKRTDEYLAAMRSLWSDEVSEYHGELYDLRPCRMYPKPVQAPHPPIHVGGETDAALRRVARLGQGWFSFGRLPEDLPAALDRLDAALAAEGRSRGDISLSVSPYLHPVSPESVARYAELGVDRLIVLCLAFNLDVLRSQLDHLEENALRPAQG
jgi:probable F420-dependent oxidoreductase